MSHQRLWLVAALNVLLVGIRWPIVTILDTTHLASTSILPCFQICIIHLCSRSILTLLLHKSLYWLIILLYFLECDFSDGSCPVLVWYFLDVLLVLCRSLFVDGSELHLCYQLADPNWGLHRWCYVLDVFKIILVIDWRWSILLLFRPNVCRICISASLDKPAWLSQIGLFFQIVFHPACVCDRLLLNFFQDHIEIDCLFIVDRVHFVFLFWHSPWVSVSSLHPLYLERTIWFSLAWSHHFTSETIFLEFENTLWRKRIVSVGSSSCSAWSSLGLIRVQGWHFFSFHA